MPKSFAAGTEKKHGGQTPNIHDLRNRWRHLSPSQEFSGNQWIRSWLWLQAASDAMATRKITVLLGSRNPVVSLTAIHFIDSAAAYTHKYFFLEPCMDLEDPEHLIRVCTKTLCFWADWNCKKRHTFIKDILSWRDSPLMGLGLLLIHEDFYGF